MSLKMIVNVKENWEALIEELERRLEHIHRCLEQPVDVEEMYRLQGEARQIRALMRLRDHVNG